MNYKACNDIVIRQIPTGTTNLRAQIFNKHDKNKFLSKAAI